jgi:hypothetical protein
VARFHERNATKVEDYFALAGDRLEALHLSVSGGESLQMRAAVNLLLLPRGAAARGAPPPAAVTPRQR